MWVVQVSSKIVQLHSWGDTMITYVGLLSPLVGLFGFHIRRSDTFLLYATVLLRRKRPVYTLRQRTGTILIAVSLLTMAYALYQWILPGVLYRG
jgi:uncharacterized membrane protein YidH (DUF202 family)